MAAKQGEDSLRRRRPDSNSNGAAEVNGDTKMERNTSSSETAAKDDTANDGGQPNRDESHNGEQNTANNDDRSLGLFGIARLLFLCWFNVVVARMFISLFMSSAENEDSAHHPGKMKNDSKLKSSSTFSKDGGGTVAEHLPDPVASYKSLQNWDGADAAQGDASMMHAVMFEGGANADSNMNAKIKGNGNHNEERLKFDEDSEIVREGMKQNARAWLADSRRSGSGSHRRHFSNVIQNKYDFFVYIEQEVGAADLVGGDTVSHSGGKSGDKRKTQLSTMRGTKNGSNSNSDSESSHHHEHSPQPMKAFVDSVESYYFNVTDTVAESAESAYEEIVGGGSDSSEPASDSSDSRGDKSGSSKNGNSKNSEDDEIHPDDFRIRLASNALIWGEENKVSAGLSGLPASVSSGASSNGASSADKTLTSSGSNSCARPPRSTAELLAFLRKAEPLAQAKLKADEEKNKENVEEEDEDLLESSDPTDELEWLWGDESDSPSDSSDTPSSSRSDSRSDSPSATRSDTPSDSDSPASDASEDSDEQSAFSSIANSILKALRIFFRSTFSAVFRPVYRLLPDPARAVTATFARTSRRWTRRIWRTTAYVLSTLGDELFGGETSKREKKKDEKFSAQFTCEHLENADGNPLKENDNAHQKTPKKNASCLRQQSSEHQSLPQLVWRERNVTYRDADGMFATKNLMGGFGEFVSKAVGPEESEGPDNNVSLSKTVCVKMGPEILNAKLVFMLVPVEFRDFGDDLPEWGVVRGEVPLIRWFTPRRREKMRKLLGADETKDGGKDGGKDAAKDAKDGDATTDAKGGDAKSPKDAKDKTDTKDKTDEKDKTDAREKDDAKDKEKEKDYSLLAPHWTNNLELRLVYDPSIHSRNTMNISPFLRLKHFGGAGVFHPPAVVSDFWNVERHYEELFADEPDHDELGDDDNEESQKGSPTASDVTKKESDATKKEHSSESSAASSPAARPPKAFRPLHLEHSPVSMIGLAIHRQVTHQLEVQMRLGEMFTRNPFSAGRQRKRKKRKERRKQNDGSKGGESGSKGGESGSSSGSSNTPTNEDRVILQNGLELKARLRFPVDANSTLANSASESLDSVKMISDSNSSEGRDSSETSTVREERAGEAVDQPVHSITLLYASNGSSIRELFMLKRILLDNHPAFLVFSSVFLMLHTLFSWLGFKNDIQFWRKAKSARGLSIRSMFLRWFCRIIIALYILDTRDTSFLIIFEILLDLALSTWMLGKVVCVGMEWRERNSGKTETGTTGNAEPSTVAAAVEDKKPKAGSDSGEKNADSDTKDPSKEDATAKADDADDDTLASFTLPIPFLQRGIFFYIATRRELAEPPTKPEIANSESVDAEKSNALPAAEEESDSTTCEKAGESTKAIEDGEQEDEENSGKELVETDPEKETEQDKQARIEYNNALTKKAMEYDEIAIRKMSYYCFPLLILYAVYSLYYRSHKSWYSYIIKTAAGFVYLFGFILMTPQIYINYRLKSVQHLPWRAMTYRALNTFVDDIRAFMLDMPWMHRISCLRDDIIFFCYLYQRWIYTDRRGKLKKASLKDGGVGDGDGKGQGQLADGEDDSVELADGELKQTRKGSDEMEQVTDMKGGKNGKNIAKRNQSRDRTQSPVRERRKQK